jgi:hypothetical protein
MVLFKKDASLISQLRDVRADRYGIRTSICLGPHAIKFEIVLEGRIRFATPVTADEICGVTTLGIVDMAASKLLANSDRWADEGVFNRDVIDLAIMKQSVHVLRDAVAKAELAYGPAVQTDLHKAVGKLFENPDWLERCMRTMKMITTMPAQLVAALYALSDSI